MLEVAVAAFSGLVEGPPSTPVAPAEAARARLTGGEKVQPAEVEALLAEALGAETCVVGVPDPEWGCVVGAVVSQRDLDDVVRALAAVSARLAKHALPRLAVIVDAIPKTTGGKVDRRAIAAWPRDRWRSVRPPR